VRGKKAKKGGGEAIGVAVSDSPTGPFKDALGKPLIDRGGWGEIDPTVFIDDDGQAYLYWGNPDLYYVKLNPDMISSKYLLPQQDLDSEAKTTDRLPMKKVRGFTSVTIYIIWCLQQVRYPNILHIQRVRVPPDRGRIAA